MGQEARPNKRPFNKSESAGGKSGRPGDAKGGKPGRQGDAKGGKPQFKKRDQKSFQKKVKTDIEGKPIKERATEEKGFKVVRAS